MINIRYIHTLHALKGFKYLILNILGTPFVQTIKHFRFQKVIFTSNETKHNIRIMLQFLNKHKSYINFVTAVNKFAYNDYFRFSSAAQVFRGAITLNTAVVKHE